MPRFQTGRAPCGLPDNLVIVTLGQHIVSIYGRENLINPFRDKFQAAYSPAAIVYGEAIL